MSELDVLPRTSAARAEAAAAPARAGSAGPARAALRGMGYEQGAAALAPPKPTLAALGAGAAPNEVHDRPLLCQGNVGVHVIEAQTLLNEQAAAGLPVDSVFGGKTDKAVRDFQRSKGLKVDGLVGPKTWGALYPGGAPSVTTDEVTTPMSEKLVTGPGGATTEYKWDAKYQVIWIGDHIWVHVRIQLVGNVPQGVRQQWYDGIRAKWSQRFKFTNGKRSIQLSFVPLFTSQNPHHVINVVNKPGTTGDWNMGTFDAGDGEGDTQGDAAAHEFGHMIGNKDEYNIPDGAGGSKTLDGVMAIPSQEAKERHFTQFRDWLNARRGVGEAEYKLVGA
jgi:peptidoglycan hydrolase-like protein with peptidoglycan-binding domain